MIEGTQLQRRSDIFSHIEKAVTVHRWAAQFSTKTRRTPSFAKGQSF